MRRYFFLSIFTHRFRRHCLSGLNISMAKCCSNWWKQGITEGEIMIYRMSFLSRATDGLQSFET